MGQRRFETMGENLFKVVNKMTTNQNLCRLLKYPVADPFSTSLTDVDGDTLLNTGISIVPKIPDEDEEKRNFVVVVFDKFVINPNNAEFKIATIRFDVICPFDNWVLSASSLRPFLIMNEIDDMFQGEKLKGIGKLAFVRAEAVVLSPQLGGYTMWYQINDFN